MTPRTRSQRSDGVRSEQAILEAATELATTQGLDGLTLGRLASHAGMSKSGLFAHFGSKEELQLATIDAAERIYRREVLDPAADAAPGRERILALTDAYLSYLERRVFPGGCFFAVTTGELGGRAGRVGDRIRQLNQDGLAELTEQLRAARDLGELAPGAMPEQLAFEIDALLLGAHSWFLLTSDPGCLRRARAAVSDRLGADGRGSPPTAAA